MTSGSSACRWLCDRERCYKTPRLRRVSQWDRGEGPLIHRSADFC
jgi:hypothetical protein